MSTVELKKRAKSMIDAMGPRDLRLVQEFMLFVSTRETNAATRELLDIDGFHASFMRGLKDIKSNRVKPWRQVLTIANRKEVYE